MPTKSLLNSLYSPIQVNGKKLNAFRFVVCDLAFARALSGTLTGHPDARARRGWRDCGRIHSAVSPHFCIALRNVLSDELWQHSEAVREFRNIIWKNAATLVSYGISCSKASPFSSRPEYNHSLFISANEFACFLLDNISSVCSIVP